MSSGQWEVVGRNKKDKLSNQNSKKPAKSDKKKAVPAPKVEDILPLSQVKSIYSNMGKGNKENKKPQEKENKSKDPPKKQPIKKSEKSPESSKPKPSKSIESALNMINVKDFTASLELTKLHFPESPLVWLKELTAILNAKITPEVNDPVFSTKSDGYPLSAIPTGIKQVMEKTLTDAGKPASQVFFDYSLTAMANEMSRGHPAIGNKLWVQFLALNNPQVTVTSLEKHTSLRTSYQNRQTVGLSILWALGQGGIKDFHIGLKVFKDFMMPLLEMKNYSRFIIKYLSQLLNRHENVALSKDNYMFLLDLINTKRSLPNEVAQELGSLNKKLKAMLLKSGDKKYSTFFEPLLSKLVSTASTPFKNEISDTLVNCLVKDTSCYNAWNELYAKQSQQSSILLKYIKDHWKKINSQLDKKQFKELLNSFSKINVELLSKSKKDASLKELENLCKALLDKMTVTKSFPWKFLSFVVILTSTSLLAYDFNQHGSWKKTQSVRTLKDIGVWEYGEKAWDGAHQGLNWTRQRIEEYAPGYIDATGEVLHPYVELVRDLGVVSYNVGERMTHKVAEKVPVVIASIEKYAPGLLDQIGETWKLVSSSSLDYWNKSYKYITTEIFVGQLSPENMQKVLANTVDTTQKFAIEYYNWVYEKVQTMIQGGK